MSNGQLTAQLVTAIASIETTLASVQSVSGADTATLSALQQQIAAAQSLAQRVLDYYDQQLQTAGAPANFASGTDPAIMAQNVNALVGNAVAITAALDCVSKLGRLAKNVAAIGN